MSELAEEVKSFVGVEVEQSHALLLELSGQPTGILNSLAELNRVLAGTDGFDNVLRRALEVLNRQYGVIRAAVFMRDEDRADELQIAASFGFSPRKKKYLEEVWHSFEQSTVLHVVRTGSEFITPAPDRKKIKKGSPQNGAEDIGDTRFLIHLPILLQKDKPIGVISLETICPRDQDQQSLLYLFRVVASMMAQSYAVNQLVESATRRMLDENANLRAELSEHYDFSPFIGDSGSMRQVYEQIAQVACTNATVLINGETGTGKELVAHALHKNSPRAPKPLIKVNCAALPESLLETELFGHERGAFTGAFAGKTGRFELAEGGTLFLDEIGELSAGAQIKLLRVLQEREFERVGGTVSLKADVRVITATNRDLEKEVAAGRFRADLYYRLNVFTITTPTLRRRREDVPALAEYFLKKYARQLGKNVSQFSPFALEMLMAYDWPGNVRELENAMERAVVVANNTWVHHYHLPPALQSAVPANEPGRTEKGRESAGLLESVETYERDLICEALKITRGNRNQAAKRLKISERLLSYKVKKYAIDCDLFRN